MLPRPQKQRRMTQNFKGRTRRFPAILRDFANLALKEHVALVGMGSKFELWNLDNWEKKQSGLQISGEDLIDDLPAALEEMPF